MSFDLKASNKRADEIARQRTEERRRRLRALLGDEEAERRFAEEAVREERAIAEYHEARRREQRREVSEAFGDDGDEGEEP